MERLQDTVLVLFGVTGDLARRKILPALYRLDRSGLLPERFHVVGISRKGTTAEEVVSMIASSAPTEDDAREFRARFADRVSVVGMRIDQPGEYEILSRRLAELDRAEGRPLARIFYLAIPATLFPLVAGRLSESDINDKTPPRQEARFLIEKPFGHDAASARALVDLVNSRFSPSQVYRIDHYLAKETAQNILAFRFENPLFARAWNGRHVSHVRITAAEEIGIEGRAAFYEGMGAFRDLVQSHLLQLLALVTMDRPASLAAADVHRAKEELLSRVMPPSPDRMRAETMRAQYRSYRSEVGNPDSLVETYAACRLSIDSEKWRGVPILIRTGKALREKVTEITLSFADPAIRGYRNDLTLRIQPNEGIVTDLRIKKPGFESECEEVQLDYCYRERADAAPEAYERVLYDALRSDQTLFATGREVLECWRVSEPILKAWATPGFPIHEYETGSWGPEAADLLAADAGTRWLDETHRVCPLRFGP